MLLRLIGGFVATASISIGLHVPKKYIVYCGITGALGGMVFLLMEFQGAGASLSNFLATVIVAVAAHMLARLLKAPVILFLIPGIIPLVPGAGMYRLVSEIIGNDYQMAAFYFFETMKMAGAIALGIFIVDTGFGKGVELVGKVRTKKNGKNR